MEASKEWTEHNNNFIDKLCGEGKCDVNDFIQWQGVRQTMFHGCNELELHALKNNNWSHWQKGIKEDKFGNPPPYHAYKKSSGNLIHHGYNLSHLRPDGNLEGINSVFEFGGGYGSFCRLLYRLGFTGTYTIYDLPALLELQELFLQKIGLDLHSINRREVHDGDKQVNLIDNITEPLNVDLFVATWSLSEAPIDLRHKIMNNVTFKECLIIYQESFGGYDNTKYFAELVESMPGYEWTLTPIEHTPHSHCLIGKKYLRREGE